MNRVTDWFPMNLTVADSLPPNIEAGGGYNVRKKLQAALKGRDDFPVHCRAVATLLSESGLLLTQRVARRI